MTAGAGHPFFAHPRILTISVLIAFLLSLPLLFNGYFLDDYQQRITLLTGGGNVFDFFSRGSPAAEAQMEAGLLPWWTWEDNKVRFFRPLAQWLMALDHAWWPDSLLLMHLHSVLWYLLLVLVAGLAYRAIMPAAWAAGLAAMLFAVDSAHAGAVGWLANRNVLVCLLAGLLCLLCHRRDGPGWQVAAWVLFGLGLAAGESALAITAYLFAHEVCLAQRPWRARVLRLLPYALIALAWIAWWRIGGYGTAGPGFYIDPGQEPLRFLQEMPFRAPAYLAGWFFVPSADVFGLLMEPATRVYALVWALLVLALLGWLLWPLLRVSAPARFYALGMVVAVIPICGSAVVSRALWFVGFGAIGLLALYAHQWRALAVTPRAARLARGFVAVMLALHLWISPVMFMVYGKTLDVLDSFMDTRVVQLPNTGAPRDLLLLSSLTHVGNVTFPLLRDQALALGPAPTRPTPAIRRVRGLVEGEGGFVLSRPAPDLLLARAERDRPHQAFSTLRAPPYRFRAGDAVRLSDVTVTVREVNAAGMPVEIAFAFRPGALADYQVLSWQRDRFVADRLPEVGSSRRLMVEKSF